MRRRNTSYGIVPEARVSSFQLLEKYLALYGCVMLPKPAFNIRNSEDFLLWAGRCGKRTCPRWWKVRILRWRVLRRRTFYEHLSRPVCHFCKPWHGFNGNSSRELRSAKRTPPPPPPPPPFYFSLPVEGENISPLPVIQINVISHPESRFRVDLFSTDFTIWPSKLDISFGVLVYFCRESHFA